MTTATGMRTTGYETDWVFGIQWKPVVAAAFVGFAVTLIMTTLGAAIGLTAGDAGGRARPEAIGIGAGLWWVLTVAVTGVIAGRVLASTARRDLNYRPVIYGTLVWIVGVLILLFLLATGVGNVIGGLGGGMGAAAAANNVTQQGGTGGTPADTMQAMETAMEVGRGAAWGLLVSMVVGLVATIIGAGRRERAALPAVEAPPTPRAR